MNTVMTAAEKMDPFQLQLSVYTRTSTLTLEETRVVQGDGQKRQTRSNY